MATEKKVDRAPWSPEEVAVLVHYVNENGEKEFLVICQKTELQRKGKACRNKWKGLLKGRILLRPVLPLEEAEIFKWHRIYQGDWLRISKHIPIRTVAFLIQYYKEKVNAFTGNPTPCPSIAASPHLPSSSSTGLFAGPAYVSSAQSSTEMEAISDDPWGLYGDFISAGVLPSPSEGFNSLWNQFVGLDTPWEEIFRNPFEGPRDMTTPNAVHAHSNAHSVPSMITQIQAEGHQMEAMTAYQPLYSARGAPQDAGYPAAGLNPPFITLQDVINSYFDLLYMADPEHKQPHHQASGYTSKEDIITKEMQIPRLFDDAVNGASVAGRRCFQPNGGPLVTIEKGLFPRISGTKLQVGLAERLIKNFRQDTTAQANETEANASHGASVCSSSASGVGHRGNTSYRWGNYGC